MNNLSSNTGSMTSCPRCGTTFNEYGVCPKCGLKRGSAASAVIANSFMSGLGSYLKGFFSSNPFNAAANAGTSAGKDWQFLAPFTGVLTTLSMWGIMIRDLVPDRLNVVQAVIAMLSFGKKPDMITSFNFHFNDKISGLNEHVLSKGFVLLLASLAVAALFFLASSATLFLWHRIQGKSLSFTQACNLRSASMLPFALFSVAALGISFFSVGLSLLALLFGGVMSALMLYFGSQKASRFARSPFWAFIGLLAADALAMYLCPMLFYWIFF